MQHAYACKLRMSDAQSENDKRWQLLRESWSFGLKVLKQVLEILCPYQDWGEESSVTELSRSP